MTFDEGLGPVARDRAFLVWSGVVFGSAGSLPSRPAIHALVHCSVTSVRGRRYGAAACTR